MKTFAKIFRIGLAAVTLGLAVTGLLGCASMGTYNPATGRTEFIAISTADEINMGQGIHQDMLERYTILESGPYVTRTRNIGQNLALVSDRQDHPYQFFVIKKDDMNAFTIPGGNIYVFTGLIDRLPDDDALAFVMAHEIGHAAARHSAKKFQAALGYDLLGSILINQIGGSSAQTIARLSTDTIMRLVFSAYSRKDEHEADRLGIKYLGLADFDLQGAIRSLEILEKYSKGTQIPGILRTHPFLTDRIVSVKREIAKSQVLSISGNERKNGLNSFTTKN